MAKVSLAKCPSYDYGEVRVGVERALSQLGGLGSFVGSGQKVLLKANMLGSFAEEKAVCTNPMIVRVVAEMCRELGAEVFVGDSPAFDTPEDVFRVSGIGAACEEAGAKAIGLGDPVELQTKNAFASNKLWFSKRLGDFDAIINLPKLKTHVFAQYTGAVKNCFGYVPKAIKSDYHLRFPGPKRFSRMLLDVYTAFPPKLTVMDAVVGMDGDGPSAGNPKQIGAILASGDGLALDAAACRLVGIEPREISVLSEAGKLGLLDFGGVDVVGEPLDEIEVRDFVQARGSVEKLGFLANIAGGLFDSKPVLEREKCVSCGKCYGICPAAAISFDKKRPEFDYKACIRCFCCHEVCPEKAIVRRKSFGLRVYNRLRGLPKKQ